MLPVTRAFHVNVNCTDLERSQQFYVLLGLEVVVHAAPDAPQPGAAFGLDQAHWDAVIMAGPKGMAGPVLDLLQWLVPTPTGSAAALNERGFARLGFGTADIDATYARLAEAGHDCWFAPFLVEESGLRTFVCSDPDGTVIEVLETGAPGLVFVGVSSTNDVASSAYYLELFGLSRVASFDLSDSPLDPEQLRLSEPGRYRGDLLADRESGLSVLPAQWLSPALVDRTPRAANELGIFRLAFLTTDIDEAARVLAARGIVPLTPVAELIMGPELPPVRALFWHGPDGECLELIESP